MRLRSPVAGLTASVAIGVAAGLHLSVSVWFAVSVAVLLMIGSGRFGWNYLLAGSCFMGLGAGVATQRGDLVACRTVWEPGNRTAILTLHDAPGISGVTQADVRHADDGCRGWVRVRLSDREVRGGESVIAVGVVLGGGVFRVDHVRRLSWARRPRFVVRELVRRRIEALYGSRAPLVEAMVLGRRHDIQVEIRSRFVSAGLAHLLAISGLHVGIFGGWITLGARRVLRGARPWIAGAASAWCYVLLLGFPIPATRAATFLTIAALGRLRERNPPTEAVIATAVMLLLFLDPGVVSAVGAWLSVCAVWSTAVASDVLGARSQNPGAAARLVATSIGATIGTAPITAFAFGNVAPIGVLTNLVAIPLASMVVPAVFLSIVAGKTIAAGTGLLLAALELVARVGAWIPGGHLEGVPGWRFAAPWMLLAGIAWWWVDRRPPLRTAVRRLVIVGAVAGWGIVVLPALRNARFSQTLEIHVLDVGQGDAIAVKTPGEKWILIDGGPRTPRWDAGGKVVIPFLRRRGVDELEAVILSHGDADHLGGLPSVMRSIPAKLAMEPGLPLGTQLYLEFQGAVDNSGTRWMAARAGDTLIVDSVVFAIVHPADTWLERGLGPNESSVVVRLSYRGFDALFTGDIGDPSEVVLRESMEPVEVLKVGHHGSRSSTGKAWLARLRPHVAIVSVGQGNRYGHPAPDVMARLSQEDIVVYRTDQLGPVTVRTDGRYFEVTTQQRITLGERLICLVPESLRSSVSSPIRKDCTPRRQDNSRGSFTTSP